MSQSNLSLQVDQLLLELRQPEPKRRLAAIERLEKMRVTGPQIIAALEYTAAHDPAPIVRNAARNGLKKRGVAMGSYSSAAPAQKRSSGLGILLTVVLAFVFLIVFVCVFMLISGPQIGNIFSRVTDGLAGT